MTNPTDPAAVEIAARIVREFRPDGWPSKQDEIARLIQRSYGDQREKAAVERVVAALETEQNRLDGEDYIMDTRDCIDVIKEMFAHKEASDGTA